MTTDREQDVSRGIGMRLVAAFVVGFVGLSLEIAYTRVISFKIFYYYTYFVIGLALLGLGAASTAIALSTRLRTMDPLVLVRRAAPVAGLVGAIAYVVVANIATDANLIWVGTRTQALEQLLRLFTLSLVLTAVFFGVGLILARLIVAEAHEVRRLYFWDLTGAALGCLTAVPLQATIGPPTMILLSSVILVGLGVAVAVQHRVLSPSWIAVAAVAVVAAVSAGTFDVRADATKSLRPGDDSAGGDWGPVFRVDAVQVGDLYLLHHDGLFGSAIWRYDGTRETTARFDTDSRQVPFAALGRDAERILIIGAAGGNEIQAALTFGVGHVDAVELNPVTVGLLEGEFADFSGNLTARDDVDYIQGDGRTYLARTDELYDLVWFVAPDSYAASNAATSGAFVLSESYLYTEEMIQSAYDHLTPDGMVVTQFGDFDFDVRPTRTARYLVTAREALADEVPAFADQSALVVDQGDVDLTRFSTIMLFKQPPGPDVSRRIEAALSNIPASTPFHLPDGSVDGGGVTTALIRGSDAEVADLVGGYRYDISAIDDDRPFFWHFASFSAVAGDWSRSFEDLEIAIGERLLLVLIAIAIVVATLCLGLPFVLTRRRTERAAPIPGRSRMFVYFAAIGLGFMFVEISMIQRFALLLGYPTLSLSVSLFSLLLATALGARWSGRVGTSPRVGLPLAVVALWVVTVTYLLISDAVTDVALAWSQPYRIALVIAMLMPVGIALGVFLPAGIDRATALVADVPGGDEGRFVAWCWAVNGFFSVIGSSVTTVASMTFGFDRTVVIGLLLYLVALAAGLAHTGSTAVAAGREPLAGAHLEPVGAALRLDGTA
ncbi:MAG: hypothetical protein HKN44_13195 [Ilumatobacter sp.]|nr:hypothetical protein [Ilumatobacter sp.]